MYYNLSGMGQHTLGPKRSDRHSFVQTWFLASIPILFMHLCLSLVDHKFSMKCISFSALLSDYAESMGHLDDANI
ncbi:hypothetical protein VNO80_11354 [Phaseolus coccineus]|uniref:Uncharacterized protein n=1 Tax=Phaseolus coccineus TaxID=3886 RepID=A0AAN9RET7_PHACN